MSALEEEPLAVVAVPVGASVVEVLVVGELDIATRDRLLDELGEGFAAGADVVDVVLHGLRFADSTGVMGLLDLRDAATAAGARLRLVGVPDPVRFVLETTGLLAEFDVVDAEPG